MTTSLCAAAGGNRNWSFTLLLFHEDCCGALQWSAERRHLHCAFGQSQWLLVIALVFVYVVVFSVVSRCILKNVPCFLLFVTAAAPKGLQKLECCLYGSFQEIGLCPTALVASQHCKLRCCHSSCRSVTFSLLKSKSSVLGVVVQFFSFLLAM